MDEPLYRLRALRVEYGGRRVLDLPEVDLRRGGITVFVGPNGAGKTTLLRVLALLLPPTHGVVEFSERAVTHREPEITAQRWQVTLVAQTSLLFHRSVRANVAYGLRARGLAARGLAGDNRIDGALAAVGLVGFGSRPAWKLSGGEAQRVAIARALACDPPVYLFDEPTASVDRQHVPVIESLIKRLAAESKTVIMTTHNLEQAYRLGDAVVSLVEGRVTPFPLVNLLRGSSAHSDDVHYFLSGGLRIEIPSAVAPRSIAIDPIDILVSRAPLHSSARNCFPGRIVKVEHDDRGMLLTVDCGPALVARITRHAYEELALNVGTAVYVTFKASAIHIVDEGGAVPVHGP